MSAHLTRRAVLGGATLVMTTPRRGNAAQRRVRLGQNNSAESAHGVGCTAFAAAVAANPVLQNVLHIAVYHEGSMGDEVVSIQGCLDGTIDMAMISGEAVSNFVPLMGIFDIPFLFKHAQAARTALDGELGTAIIAEGHAKGLNILAFGENGVRHMTANRPIRHPADMAGLKMRVPQSENEVAGFRALGANPSPIPAQKLREMLRTGEVEAEENALGVIETYRLYEVQKYLSLTGHIYSSAPMLVSQDLLDDLSDNERLALQACAKKAAAASREAGSAAEKDYPARLRAAGMTIVDDVDKAAFIAAAKANFSAMSAKFGADLIARLQQSGA